MGHQYKPVALATAAGKRDTVSHLYVGKRFGKSTGLDAGLLKVFWLVNIAAGALVLHSKQTAAVIIFI